MAVVVLMLLALGIFSMPVNANFVNTGTLKYLGSAIIQSFAALVAIPFAFYASYLHGKYGYAGLQFAVNRVKTHIFPIFALVGLISILLILFPNYPDIPNFGLSYNLALKLLLFGEIVASSILLLIIYRHLIEVMSATPLKLVNWVMEHETRILHKYKLAQELLIISLKDSTLHQDSEEILDKIVNLLDMYSHEKILSSLNELRVYHQIFKSSRSIATTLINTGQVISPSVITKFVQALSAIYVQFNSTYQTSIETPLHEEEIIWRIHESFYDTILDLSILYNMNFHRDIYEVLNENLPEDESILVELQVWLIEKNLEYIKMAHYWDEKDDREEFLRLFTAVSQSDFIFDILIKSKPKTLETIITNTHGHMQEFISWIANILILPKSAEISLFPIYNIHLGKKPIKIQINSRNSEHILNLLGKWSESVLHLSPNSGNNQFLNELLIENLAKLYSEFECMLRFKEGGTIVLWSDKLKMGRNIMKLSKEEIQKVCEYLLRTPLQKYLSCYQPCEV
ncbi:hypothetical protein [Palaeococcus sp. (in: euryarchaeotes)]